MPKKNHIQDNLTVHTLERQAVLVLYEEFVKGNPWSSDYALRFGWYLVENWSQYQEIVEAMKEPLSSATSRTV